MHFWDLEKQEKTKPQISRRKEITKTTGGISETESLSKQKMNETEN
jgi:hypothetical protein